MIETRTRLPLDAVPLRPCGLIDLDEAAPHERDCLWCSRPLKEAPKPRTMDAGWEALAERNRKRRSWVSGVVTILEDGYLELRSPLSQRSRRLSLDPAMTVRNLLPKLVGALRLPRAAPDGTPWRHTLRFASDWTLPEGYALTDLAPQEGLVLHLISMLRPKPGETG